MRPGGGGRGPAIMAGGQPIESDFGTLHVPNISSGPCGIGGSSLPDFARAVPKGVSPEGGIYPAFPYTSYAQTDADVVDLFAYIMTLPASASDSQPHEVGFPSPSGGESGLWNTLIHRMM